jgi:hypothetical protein
MAEDSEVRRPPQTPDPKTLIADSHTVVAVPAIFPRRRRRISEFRRLRRDRTVYLAGCRLARHSDEIDLRATG